VHRLASVVDPNRAACVKPRPDRRSAM
jgi:hypothetical protein